VVAAVGEGLQHRTSVASGLEAMAVLAAGFRPVTKQDNKREIHLSGGRMTSS